ncbi:DUF7521 family protein [Halorubrum tibetense]|uniref:Uncharacterized protein n=1 Tax=Halorubrum tibetense TaxID=175631 RepID=A0ABD5S8J8_9EURY
MIDAALGGGLLAFGLTATSTVLGVAIGILGLIAYRRSGERPMLYVGTGFVLVFWTPLLSLVGTAVLPARSMMAAGYALQGVQIVGLCCILYGLWTPRS